MILWVSGRAGPPATYGIRHGRPTFGLEPRRVPAGLWIGFSSGGSSGPTEAPRLASDSDGGHPLVCAATGAGKGRNFPLPTRRAIRATSSASTSNQNSIRPHSAIAARSGRSPLSLERYRSVYIIQPYREQEKYFSPSCLNAKGHDCESTWARAMVQAMMGAGSKYPRPSPRDGARNTLPIGC